MASPHDYRYSAWFNRSRPASVVFVPASCCLDSQSPGGDSSTVLPPGGARRNHWPVSADSRRVITDTQCQLEAILFPLHPSYSTANRKPYTLKTQVAYRSSSSSSSSYHIISIDIIFTWPKQETPIGRKRYLHSQILPGFGRLSQ